MGDMGADYGGRAWDCGKTGYTIVLYTTGIQGILQVAMLYLKEDGPIVFLPEELSRPALRQAKA